MALLGMTPEEYDYMVSNISEALKLIGQDAMLYQIYDVEKDLYNDTESLELLSHRDIGLIFEDNPRPVLKKFNWLTEEEEIPYLAYICSKDSRQEPLVVQDRMLIRIKTHLGIESDKLFQVTSVRGNSVDPLYWICKLVPYRNKVDFNPETPKVDSTRVDKTDVNFAYLKVNENRNH